MLDLSEILDFDIEFPNFLKFLPKIFESVFGIERNHQISSEFFQKIFLRELYPLGGQRQSDLMMGDTDGGPYREGQGWGGGTPMGPLFKVKQQLLQIIDLIRFTLVKSCDGINKLNQQTRPAD